MITAIHERMPVVLTPEVWDAWLDRDLTDPNQAESLLQPIDPDLIHEHAVSSEVNSVRNNNSRLTEPANQPRLL
jgi:putative SOS response-associated peptidase YedK